ncbi:MAG TPA: glutamine--tRNA ligase/YqeY domain fusion protein [Polyangiaceae bacterium]|nr:glutamine--tRNA ligase/YqeY domain fusion protein [Polyangiaceae bacterium]
MNDKEVSSPAAGVESPAETRNDGTPGNFVEDIVRADLASGKNSGRVMTRFPPEPNGYLHIGHAKSICLNFGLAQTFGGKCNLRYDDTNPETEDPEFVESIERDVRWLGFDWEDRKYFASDYFGKLHEFAVKLIEAGKAYVDERDVETIRKTRGDYYQPGEESPFRNRSIADNLERFEKMRRGEYPDGSCVLRAKIDMASTDVKLRDPVMYRIRRAHHHRTGDTWCIYPTYDWAHGQSDAIEGVTHSVCTLEFVNHRPLYHWYLDALGLPSHPEQIEFARLAVTYMLLSKRKLQELVEGGYVADWDDPRMPTLAGMRRRGFTPEAIRAFCERIGVSTRDSQVDVSLLEHALRDHLNATSPRVMAVLKPLKIVLDNFPEGRVDELVAPYDPEKPEGATRKVPFSRVLYIDRDDFAEQPAKKWFRLAPGQEVRLRYACIVRCTDVVKDASGTVTEVHCSWDEKSQGGHAADGRKIKGTIHWVSAAHALPAEARLYDRLFVVENPVKDKDVDWKTHVNPKSLEVMSECLVEPSLASAHEADRFQFERVGYFCVDRESRPERLVFNRTISLKDSWAAAQSGKAGS